MRGNPLCCACLHNCLSQPWHATPVPAMPQLPVPAMACHTCPSHAMPHLSQPCLSQPCHNCLSQPCHNCLSQPCLSQPWQPHGMTHEEQEDSLAGTAARKEPRVGWCCGFGKGRIKGRGPPRTGVCSGAWEEGKGRVDGKSSRELSLGDPAQAHALPCTTQAYRIHARAGP